MKIDQVMEDLYEIYREADKKNKPGVSLVLDMFYGNGYVAKRERLTETVRVALVESEGTLTTTDVASDIAAAIISTYGIGN